MNELPSNNPELTPTLQLLAEVGATRVYRVVELDPTADFPTLAPVQPDISPAVIAVTRPNPPKIDKFFDELDRAA